MKTIKFSVNNWIAGKDFPNEPPFTGEHGWMCSIIPQLNSDKWAKENKLCIICKTIDMSFDYTIIASEDWVMENCPCIIGSKWQYPDDAEENNYYTEFPRDYWYDKGAFGVTFLSDDDYED